MSVSQQPLSLDPLEISTVLTSILFMSFTPEYFSQLSGKHSSVGGFTVSEYKLLEHMFGHLKPDTNQRSYPCIEVKVVDIKTLEVDLIHKPILHTDSKIFLKTEITLKNRLCSTYTT